MERNKDTPTLVFKLTIKVSMVAAVPEMFDWGECDPNLPTSLSVT